MTNLMSLITEMQKENEKKAYEEAKAAATKFYEEVVCKEIEKTARNDYNCRECRFEREGFKFLNFMKDFLGEQGFGVIVAPKYVTVTW